MFAIRKLSRRESAVALAAALAAAAAITYNAILEPLAMRWVRLDKEIKKKASDIRKDKKLLSYKMGESDYAKFSAYLGAEKSEEEDVSDTLTLIESVCRESSCRILSMRSGSIKTSGQIKEMAIDMEIEAPIEALSEFLYNVETRSDMALKISKFTINSKALSGGTVKCALTIDRMLASKSRAY